MRTLNKSIVFLISVLIATLFTFTAPFVNHVYAQSCYTLTTTVNPIGGGNVVATPAQNCAGGYLAGTVVQLKANAAAIFSSWSGDASGTSNPVSITMDGNKNVTANFIAAVLVAPAGTVTWNNLFSWTGVSGATKYYVEVRKADETVLYLQWSTAAQASCDADTDCNISPAVFQTLASGDYKWRVNAYGAWGYGAWTAWTAFHVDATCYTVTTSVNPVGAGNVVVTPAQNCTGGYLPGTVAQLKANAAAIFASWSGDAIGTFNPVSVTMNSNKNVTANFIVATLIAPTGTLSTWNNTFSWTGVSGATKYYLQVHKADDTVVLEQWYTAAQSGCDADTSCVISPMALQALLGGSYKWRINAYGAWGYGAWTDWMAFNLKSVVLTSLSGTLTAWSNAFNWTGVDDATYYVLEVYDTSSGSQIVRKWYTTNKALCDTDLDCTVSPTEFQTIRNGTYRWRVAHYNAAYNPDPALGYGPWATNIFTLNAPCYTLTTSIDPVGGGTVSAPTPSCSGGSRYTAGSVLQLTEVPNIGYSHAGWSGDVTALTRWVMVPMDADKSVTAHFRTVALGAPSGILTTWNGTFSWTAPTGATKYYLEVRKADETVLYLQWQTAAQAGCDADTSCDVSPASLQLLPSGNYKWRVMPYGDTWDYGYGAWTDWRTFSLNLPCYTLTINTNPIGSGNIVATPAQNCTGGYLPGTAVQLKANAAVIFTSWSGDASGVSNPVSVTMDSNKNITANFISAVLSAPTGTLSAWNNTFSWTTPTGATKYYLEVRKADETVLHMQWYTAAQAGCDVDLSCDVLPAALQTLPNGNYKWRVNAYGAWGYGAWTDWMTFTLNLP